MPRYKIIRPHRGFPPLPKLPRQGPIEALAREYGAAKTIEQRRDARENLEDLLRIDRECEEEFSWSDD